MLLASLVLESWSFRMLFWATLALDLPLFGAALLLIRNHAAIRRTTSKIDWLGAILLSGALVGLLLGIELTETSFAQAGMMAAAAVLVLAAALWRFRVAPAPLIELAIRVVHGARNSV